MERLREKKPSPGSLEAVLVEAVKCRGRLEMSPVGQRRVLEHVLARVLEQKVTDRLRVRFFTLPFVAGGLLSIAGATAASTLAYRWANRRAPVPAVYAPVNESVRRATGNAQSRLAGKTPEREAMDRHATPVRYTVPPSTARSGTSRTHTEKIDDPSWVVDAVRALRQDHDPLAAKRLLSEYLQVYPHGALSEEAIALSIEAAEESGDPNAPTFAAHYLANYPDGRFRRTAELVLNRHRH